MKVSKVDHIGIAVNSIDESLKLYRDALGLEFKGIEEMPERGQRVAFIQTGESKLELLESTSETSTIAKYLSKKGEGIHHMALHVDDVEEAINNLSEKGYRLLSDKPESGAGGTKIVFMHPKSANGVLLELIEGNH
ncbi:MAG TPA: methylmalonyl-CoA epimerase [Thermotogota bacterium]|nr:methylmalonyl-CoA epimerase [Thermotogota bacterium]HPJ87734.1 methylmalonyl-CoA epimerase [Thermotogota bacterium]HPR94826.1 methylmalonyl-CoA epimerase [Thermotogota bacterium]